MTIRKFIPALFLAIACDPDTSDVVDAVEFRTETSGSCEAPPPPLPSLEKCECDDEADCGLGTDCVPVEGKGRCLAPYTQTFCHLRGQGWDNVEILAIYPFAVPGNLGAAYCPLCQECEPPDAGFLICQ